MEEQDFITKVRRIIKMRHDDVVAAMVSGGVDNMEKYQYMLGQIRTYQYMSQEIFFYLCTHPVLFLKRVHKLMLLASVL